MREHWKTRFLHWWILQVATYMFVIIYAFLDGSLSIISIFEASTAFLLGIFAGVSFFRASRKHFIGGMFDYNSIEAKKRVIFFTPFLAAFLFLWSFYFLGGNQFPAIFMAILFLSFSGYLSVVFACFERKNRQRIYCRSLAGMEMVIINALVASEIFIQIVVFSSFN